jgi:putative holliday junction resolvase
MVATSNSSVLALDVGSKRIGVAVASLIARLPHPLATLANDDSFFDELDKLVKQENVSILVVGLPRGLQGQETDQTAYTRKFVEKLQGKTTLQVDLQDESVTSEHAEAELRSHGKQYEKADIDALAATYILDDWLAEHAEVV